MHEFLKALSARIAVCLECLVTRWRNWAAPYRLAWFKSPRHEAFLDWFLIQINRCIQVVVWQLERGHLRRATYLLRAVSWLFSHHRTSLQVVIANSAASHTEAPKNAHTDQGRNKRGQTMISNSEDNSSRRNRSLFVIDPDEFKEGLGDWYLSSLLEDPAHLAVLKSINARLLFILSALDSGRIIQAFNMLSLLHGVLPIPSVLDIYSASPRRLARIRSAAQRFEQKGDF